MEIIFGKISFSNTQQSKFKDLENIVHKLYTDFLYHSFKSECVYGGVVVHPSCKSTSEDFFYNDSKLNLSIIYTGVIYNLDEFIFEEKYQKLAQNNQGKILFLYKKYGESFVNRLNGDFSIIIIDHTMEKVLLYIDHLGIRQLSYICEGNTLYFSSDYISLCKTFSENNPLNRKFLLQFIQDDSYITFQRLPSEKITRVIPGHFISWHQKDVKMNQYWFPENVKIDQSMKKDQIIREMKEIVEDAVKIRCNSESTAAAHLSGGLDSGLVAALTRLNFKNQSKFIGFSWSPDESKKFEVDIDERILIKELAMAYQIEPIYCSDNEYQYWKKLSDWSYYIPVIYENEVTEKCQKFGITHLFSGWGGDEFLSKNDNGVYYDLFWGFHWNTFFRKIPIYRFRRFISILIFRVLLPSMGIHYYIKPKDKWSYKFILPPYQNVKNDRKKDFFKITSRRSVHLRMHGNYHIPWRIGNETLLGFRNGVEYRYPLLDKRIIEFMLRIPSRLIADFPYPRPIIREISKGILPESIRLNIPKEDATRVSYLYELYNKTLPFFLDEFCNFKKNPDLDFINFEELEKAITSLQNKTYKYDEIDFLILLNNIKKVHEFTKGYRNLDL